jgi:hypothetical protein
MRPSLSHGEYHGRKEKNKIGVSCFSQLKARSFMHSGEGNQDELWIDTSNANFI